MMLAEMNGAGGGNTQQQQQQQVVFEASPLHDEVNPFCI